MVPNEHLQAQGLPVYSDSWGLPYKLPWASVLAELDGASKVRMAGNSIHCHVSASLTVMILSCVLRRKEQSTSVCLVILGLTLETTCSGLACAILLQTCLSLQL